MDPHRGYLGVLRELYVDADIKDPRGELIYKLAYIDTLSRELLDLTDSVMLLHLSLSTGIVSAEECEGMKIVRLRETLLKDLLDEGLISDLELTEQKIPEDSTFKGKVAWAEFNTTPAQLIPYLAEMRTAISKEMNKRPSRKKISLQGVEMDYDDDRATISALGRVCSLPPNKNEHCYARVMFRVSVGVPVESADIYTEMTGKSIENREQAAKAHKSVSDTMYELIKRVKSDFNTNDKLFTKKDKLITRKF